MNIFQRSALLLSLFLMLAGCATSDTTLRDQGNSESYITGFHDGRHSGMKEAGNNWEHFIRDQQRFDSDSEYRAGWLAGEAEGKKIQAQANSIGEAAAGSYGSYQIGKEVKRNEPDPEAAAKDAMKGVNTDDLKVLEQ